jgi:hypothetical protein
VPAEDAIQELEEAKQGDDVDAVGDEESPIEAALRRENEEQAAEIRYLRGESEVVPIGSSSSSSYSAAIYPEVAELEEELEIAQQGQALEKKRITSFKSSSSADEASSSASAVVTLTTTGLGDGGEMKVYV